MAIPACITGGIPINSDNFEDGFVAADRGDYKTAYKLWLPLKPGLLKLNCVISRICYPRNRVS
jgi:hypothetical protein